MSTDAQTFPLVSCMMATYGRHSQAERALACFLRQDYPNAELIILNNHAVRMRLDPTIPAELAAKIRLHNEPCYASLGACRTRMLELARGEFVRTWDDDDIYLPWSISQGMEYLTLAMSADPTVPAWKPEKSWWCNGGKTFSLEGNAMEATILIRAEIARKYGYQESGGDEHSPLLAGLSREANGRGIATADMGVWTGYCYTWGVGNHHISGTINSGKSIDVRTHEWMQAQQDAPRRPLTPNYAAAEEWWGRISQFAGADQREFMERCRGIL